VRLWTASIYAWAGVAKLNADWLSGRTLGDWIDQGGWHGWIADVLAGTAARALLAPAVACGEVALAVFLLARPTRRLALVGAYAMHATFEVTMAPDVFGWAMAILLLAFVGEIGPWADVFKTRAPARERAPLVVAMMAVMMATAAGASSGCSSAPPPTADADANAGAPCADALVLGFVPDTAGAPEAYVCYGFDAAPLAGATLRAVTWQFPAGGSVVIHHAKLYAVPGDFPDGPVPCDGMPAGALALHIAAPGSTELSLPADTGLRLPAGTARMVVELHALAIGTGPPSEASVALCRGPAAPAHVAALMAVAAPVPALRPATVETSDSSCTLGGDVHLYSIWPHMHLLGQEIEVDSGPQGGSASVLIDVAPWRFQNQAVYPLDVDASGGGTLRLRCTWNNTTDHYVFAGPRTEDEMCQAGLIAWPAAAATCTP